MRKVILTLVVVTSIISCGKKEKVTEISFPYKAEDGTRAKATIITDSKGKKIEIQANNTMFQLDHKSFIKDGEIYERNGITAKIIGDSLFIEDDKQIISLVQVK